MKNILYSILLLCFFSADVHAQSNFKRTGKGLLYFLATNNAGERIKLNDVITFQVIQKTDKDSVLFSTYAQGRPVKAQIRPSANITDLMEVFPLLTVNDSVVVKVPVDTVFKGHETEMPPFFTKGGNIVFNIKILKVQSLNDAMAERNAELESIKNAEATDRNAYIKANKLTPKLTPSGLQYIVTKSGPKARPLVGDTVLVNYTGRTLDGKVFDSSIAENAKAAGLDQPGRTYEPIKFALGSGRIIQGWEEGLLLLNEGSKAFFIIPSNLGYGERGMPPAIKPFSTLLFDIELVNVIRVKHSPAKAFTKTPVKAKAPLKKRVPVKKKN